MEAKENEGIIPNPIYYLGEIEEDSQRQNKI
jgi:hypothetical protein